MLIPRCSSYNHPQPVSIARDRTEPRTCTDISKSLLVLSTRQARISTSKSIKLIYILFIHYLLLGTHPVTGVVTCYRNTDYEDFTVKKSLIFLIRARQVTRLNMATFPFLTQGSRFSNQILTHRHATNTLGNAWPNITYSDSTLR